MLRRVVLYWVAVMALSLAARAQTNVANYYWAMGIGGPDDDIAYGVATDSEGTSYITGHFGASAEFTGIPNLTSRGDFDVFIAKFTKAGKVVWARRAGSTNVDDGRSISIDHTGNALVVGAIHGDADFPGTNLFGLGADDAFVAKFSRAGDLRWVKQAGGAGGDSALGVATDASDNCLVTGYFSALASFGTTNLSARGQTDAFIAKYNADGDLQWVRQAGSSGFDEGRAIAVAASGDTWVTGNFGGGGAFEGTNVTAQGRGDIFVARYDPGGQLRWVASAGGTNAQLSDSGAGIALDASDNSYVCGTFYGYAAFGETNLSTRSQSAMFLAKYDAAGRLLWIVQDEATAGSSAFGVALDDRDTVTVCGLFTGSVVFGTNTLRSRSGQADSFVARYTRSEGNLLWVTQTGGNGYNACYGIGLDGEGRVYTTGWFRSHSSFGDIQVTNRLFGRDAYIARIDPPPLLRIAAAVDAVVLSWPAEATNFSPQSSALLPPTNWAALPNTPATVENRRVVTNASVERSFYRLLRQ